MLDALWQDVRYAIRALRRNPGFAAVAVLSLALGIGANTAIFSLIDALVLKSLPVSHPEELVQVTMGSPWYFSNPIWEQLRDRQDIFAGVFAYGRWNFNLARGGEVRNVNGQYVSGEYFDTLGVRTVLGRTLTRADDRRGCAGTAVLSHGFWQREYGGRADILGKTISIDDHPFEIVGVTEPGFTGVEVGASVDVLAPLCAERIVHSESSLLDLHSLPGWLQVMGRPKPGISLRQVNARLNALAPEVFLASLPDNRREEDRSRFLKHTLNGQPAANGLSYLRRQYRQPLLILMAIAGSVLLIACANVANLLLVRGAARERELAIRITLGSGRRRLVQHLLTESLLLSGAGTALGIVFAQWATRLLVAFLDVSLDLTPDLRMLAFTAGVAVVTGLLFGMAPAWRSTRVQPQLAMKANGRGVVGGSGVGFGKALVTLQVALSLVLVVAAGLLLGSLWELTSVDAGFRPDRVLGVRADLGHGNLTPERRIAEVRQMLEKLRTIPAVYCASDSNIVPMWGGWAAIDVVVDGYAATSRDDSTVLFNQVSDQFFETLAIPIVAGRDFDRRDTPGSSKVAIVSESMARKFFGTPNPLGRYLRIQEGTQIGDPYEIVGVVKDTKYGRLRDPMSPTVYLTRNQDPGSQMYVYFELRAIAGRPEALIQSAKSAIGDIDGSASLEITALSAQIGKSLSRDRLLAALSGIFGVLALMLAMMGLYGVMSYNVERRRNEIAIRVALGAEQARVVRMVLGEVLLMVGTGLAVGLGLAIAMTRFVATFLYGLAPNDPLTLSLAAAALAGAAAFAGYLPARRASRVDPMTALREE
jgi:putative ABC transport system permease protein